jgi:hypothetical protein
LKSPVEQCRLLAMLQNTPCTSGVAAARMCAAGRDRVQGQRPIPAEEPV